MLAKLMYIRSMKLRNYIDSAESSVPFWPLAALALPVRLLRKLDARRLGTATIAWSFLLAASAGFRQTQADSLVLDRSAL